MQGINQVFEMTFKTRVLNSSETSPELNQPKKCKLVLVDAHQGWLKHECFAMHMMTWPILVTITPGVLHKLHLLTLIVMLCSCRCAGWWFHRRLMTGTQARTQPLLLRAEVCPPPLGSEVRAALHEQRSGWTWFPQMRAANRLQQTAHDLWPSPSQGGRMKRPWRKVLERECEQNIPPPSQGEIVIVASTQTEPYK
jgi:hypothetical protein